MVFIFMNLPRSYKYIGAKKSLRRSISAYDVNHSDYDVTDGSRTPNSYLGTGIAVTQPVHSRNKSECSLEIVGQNFGNETSSNLRPPTLKVPKESEGKDDQATDSKDMSHKETKDQYKNSDGNTEEMVVFETTDTMVTVGDVRKTSNEDTVTKETKNGKSKVTKEAKGTTKDKVEKERKLKHGKEEDSGLYSKLNGFDENELNKSCIAYRHRGNLCTFDVVNYAR